MSGDGTRPTRPPPTGMSAWLLPTLGYVVLVGSLGVFGKLALRGLSWQELLIWTAAAYAATALALLAFGGAGLRFEAHTWWAIAAAVCTVGSLILFYLALGNGEASTVIPISAAYPAVTLILAALMLSEHVSLFKVGGMLLVIGGVIVLTVAD